MLCGLVLLMAAMLPAWQWGGSMGSPSGSLAPLPPPKAPTTRSLSGKVMDSSNTPLAHAVVYLKDSKTLNVKTYIANNDGTFLFNGLAFNQDYELHAEYEGNKSGTRTLSSFDNRPKADINLKIDVKKK